MKIESVNFPEAITSEYGLKEIKMSRLSNIVVIAGKNGAGKSRLFNLLKNEINNSFNLKDIQTTEQNIKSWKQSLIDSETAVLKLQESIRRMASSQQSEPIRSTIANHRRQIEQYQRQIQQQMELLDRMKNIVFVPDKANQKVFNFVPKSIHLDDSYTMSNHDLENKASQIKRLGTDEIATGTLPAIAMIQKRWLNASVAGDDLKITTEEKEKIESDYIKLRKYVKIFLNTDIERDADGNTLLFGRKIGQAQLSDGQKILLQFCMALFAQEANLEDLVIFMDEPRIIYIPKP